MGSFFARKHANIGKPTLYRGWVNDSEHLAFYPEHDPCNLIAQDSQPEARPPIIITVVQHVTLPLVIKNERVFDHLGVPAIWRYVYSYFIETEVPTFSALAVGVTNAVFVAGTTPVREPHLITLIGASDNRRARKSLGCA